LSIVPWSRLRRVGFGGESGLGFPPVGPAAFRSAEQSNLKQAFGTLGIPATALAFEAAIGFHFDVFLDGAAAALDRRHGYHGSAHAAPQGGGQSLPELSEMKNSINY
jgi:hypothetical protein